MSVPTRPHVRLVLALAALAGLLVGLLPAPAAHAAVTWRVGPPGTSAQVDFALVQDAIDAAADGDVVEVLPGEYAELLDFGGKAITVRSTNGPEATVLNGYRDGTVVTFDDDEGPASVLAGFTIRGGLGSVSLGSGEGGGVRIDRASPTVRDNVVVDNAACSGAGIAVAFGSPIIADNTIRDNFRQGCSGGSGGGGIRVRGDGGGTTTITGNVIADNHLNGGGPGGGIDLFAAGAVEIIGNHITGNTVSYGRGGGISIVNGTSPRIVQNEISGNHAHFEGGGIWWLAPSSTPSGVLVGNTLAGNTVGSTSDDGGAALLLDGWTSAIDVVDNVFTGDDPETVVCGASYGHETPTLQHNLFWSGTGAAFTGACTAPSSDDGNVEAAPGFVPGTFVPAPGSPLVDAGVFRPELPTGDLAGNARVRDGDGDGTATVDIGAWEADAGEWGVPAAPIGVTATLAGPDLWIDWAPPEPTGALPLLAYEVEVGDEVWSVEPDSTYLDLDADDVPDDTEVAVRAVNAAGPGPWANADIELLVVVPGEPTDLSAVRDGDEIGVTWGPPEHDGGGTIVGWVVRWSYDDDPDMAVRELTADTRSVSVPAAPDQRVFIEVMAVNQAGWGSEAFVEVPPVATTPGPVVELVANLWQDVVTVAWQPPADDGGSPVTGYRVEYAGGATTVDAATTLVELPWVPAGDAVVVTASNALGRGEEATATIRDWAEPPSEPTEVTAVGGVGRVMVSWEPPEWDGGATIADYLLQVGVGGGTTVAGDVHEYVVEGLDPGETVTVTVRARNRAGTSDGASATATTVDVPSAPRNLAATTQKRDELAISWSPPTDDGGNQLAGYRVTEVRSGQTRQVPATSTTLVLAGVDKGSWEVEVVAVNDAGTGPPATLASGGDGGDGGGPPKCHPKRGC
ncbi:fibronectin type III domain-containing protein [Salsipaludibacter albus]|uniref:fibronectin type III domain-containing protein n=1 Tax=Salsipaludibacter albus TaxID=2849650 RepID=UPI001EE48A31|nr:fibronectin type III domain-containing protein [Salsipaludibacter albus]MBY5162236.1 fibronectin type III domain-containing protein [Salsipaludibacter albus]